MKKFFGKTMMVAAALLLSTSIAFAAIPLEDAKQQGLVGEKPDGLIGIVSGTSKDVKALVDSTNAQRLAKYQAIAAKNGTPVAQVQAVAGQKLMAVTPGGEYIMGASGGWQQK